MPFAVATPILKPVYEPGPDDTATAARSREATPDVFNTLSIITANWLAAELGTSVISNARSFPSL